ncbi:hypothetical protein ACQ4PT_024870 [Festuca glaucescens]
MLFVAKRNAPRTENVRRRLPEKLFVFGVPCFGACLSLLGLAVLVKKKVEGIDVPNHELLFRCSQFLAWVSVSLVSVNGPWFEILCNPFICICWTLKILLEMPHLQYTLTVIKAMSYFMEILSFSTSITFGLFLIVATAAGRLCNKREVNSIESPLIPNNENSEAEGTNLVCYFFLSERSRFSEGEIQTFMSVDVDRTINLCNSLHDAWSLPLQIGLALYLLYTQVNYAFLSGLAITIILIPVNKSISTRIATATEHMMKQKDERISCAGELLAHIRTVKMYSWEKLFTQRLKKRRELEVKHLATRKYLDAWCVYFWATTPTLFSLFTFSIFAIMGHSLDAATVFTCVALFNTLISPLNSFPWVINGMIDAVISSKRLGNYLSSPEHCSSELTASTDIAKDDFQRNNETIYDSTAVAVRNLCCSWSNSSTAEPNIILRDICLQLPKGLFIAIVGEVGSGKSSLLNSIIGEMSIISGSINTCGSIAYVPQVPWILSGSLRDNILIGKGFDARR